MVPGASPIKLLTTVFYEFTNIRQGWKGLLGTNKLAYYENSLITSIKSFMSLVLGLASNNLLGWEVFLGQTLEHNGPLQL